MLNLECNSDVCAGNTRRIYFLKGDFHKIKGPLTFVCVVKVIVLA